MSVVQSIKSYLVKLGPHHPMVRTALRIHARQHGFQLKYSTRGIHIQRGVQSMILNAEQFVQVPIMMECFNLFFATIKTRSHDGLNELDFSQPAFHEYVHRGVGFYFPSVPEDDVMDAYTKEYLPKAGDVVWDVGAHAGATTFFLSQMVGSTGCVYAFEPDESNYAYLLRNLESHSLTNVRPVKKALSRITGRASFNMDGTMSAGIHEYLLYSEAGALAEVDTLSLADACSQFGSVPNFVKMDIEGAEVAVVEGSAKFLADYDIHFAIESFHRVGHTYTYEILNRLFPQLGYSAQSENFCGQMFTWASKASVPVVP